METFADLFYLAIIPIMLVLAYKYITRTPEQIRQDDAVNEEVMDKVMSDFDRWLGSWGSVVLLTLIMFIFVGNVVMMLLEFWRDLWSWPETQAKLLAAGPWMFWKTTVLSGGIAGLEGYLSYGLWRCPNTYFQRIADRWPLQRRRVVASILALLAGIDLGKLLLLFSAKYR